MNIAMHVKINLIVLSAGIWKMSKINIEMKVHVCAMMDTMSQIL